ncbi:hypothetical protein P378_02380 [Desulforamulus profundi]|uniref:Uncharacterized protein n=1 Tax=Desulforamulus profundi TaxID=1383067 RepID=A0A2C6MB73_9FIRM|nr:hypothetical protein P378_02380 [Desulforamulus profundi]
MSPLNSAYHAEIPFNARHTRLPARRHPQAGGSLKLQSLNNPDDFILLYVAASLFDTGQNIMVLTLQRKVCLV